MQPTYNKFVDVPHALIVSENKRLFGIDVCPTCISQLFEGYKRLKIYELNIMAKKNKPEGEEKLQIKYQYIGATHCNGKRAIIISDVPIEDVGIYFTEKEIAEYFETK